MDNSLHAKLMLRKQRLRKKFIITCACIVAALVLLIGAFFFFNRKDKPLLKKIEVSDVHANPDRSALVDKFLMLKAEAPEGEQHFTVRVVGVSLKKAIIQLKNNTDYFFTGDIVVHKLATIHMNSFAPNATKSFEVDLGITEEDNDYTYEGSFSSFENSKLLSFSLKERPLGNDEINAFLAVSSFDETKQKELAYYYYVLDSLYDFDTPTTYHLYNEDGEENLGTLIVDIPNKTVKYVKNDTTIFTETY